MLAKLVDVARPFRPLLDPMHIGTVLANNDDMQLGGIRVRIPGVLDFTNIEDHPWCYPIKSFYVGGSLESFNLFVPEVGSKVLVKFINEDDPYTLFYYGYLPNSNNQPPCMMTDYPNLYGFKDSDGTLLAIVKVLQRLFAEHATGVKCHISENGDVAINIPGNLSVNVGGNSRSLVMGFTERTSVNGDKQLVLGAKELSVLGDIQTQCTGNNLSATSKFEIRTAEGQYFIADTDQLLSATTGNQQISAGGVTAFNPSTEIVPNPGPIPGNDPFDPPTPPEPFCA